ncbi:MAG: DUF2807 domain-containing protein [Alphaproteobacteria bacterium]|nr:DUF2807 domain-containing protein [Alphaproteobacteria bacterium]
MSRKLGLIAVGGLLTAAVCFGIAASVGGRSVLDHIDFDVDGWDNPRCGVTLAGHDGSREMDWSGGDRVVIEIPANVHYARGQGDKLVVKGDAAVIPRLEIDDNRIRFNCHMRRFGQRLDITLPGRDFERYTINGSSDMTLAGIDQPRLSIKIAGSGSVTASGKTNDLEYVVAGSGDGHFEGLDAGNVSIKVAGSGDADVAPRQRLDVNIAGSGKVTLHSEPQQLETHIAGSGRIIHPDGTVTRRNGLSSDERGMMPPPPQPPQPPAPPAPPAKGI